MNAFFRRGWLTPAKIVSAVCLAVAYALAPMPAWAGPRERAAQAQRPRGRDVPLTLVASYGPASYSVAWNGKGLLDADGRQTLRLDIPGTPVAAFLYISGCDIDTLPPPHFPDGDEQVRVVVTAPGGATAEHDTVPVAYRAFNVFVNKLDITADVAAGENTIQIAGYGLNYPEGAVALAVYADPELERTRIDLFEGADVGYYPFDPPFGPDSEVVASTFAAYPPGDRTARLLMGIGGAQPGRGDEVFLLTGTGTPEDGLACRDGDGRIDMLRRQFELTLPDYPPAANDPADAAGHLEAVRGAISLEEDRLGAPRDEGGYRRGAQLDLFTHRYTIPAGHEFAAAQIQSERPENGDSFTLFLAANLIPVPFGFDPIPNITVTKAPKLTEGAPGLEVDFTFVVTAEGGTEALRDVTLVDDPPMAIVGPAGDDGDGLLELGEAWTYTAHVVFPDPGEFPDVVTARGIGVESGREVEATDDALVIVRAPAGAIVVVKETIGGDRAFEFTSDFAAPFALSGGGRWESGPLDPGTYAVAEVMPLPGDWALVSATCDDGSPVGAIAVGAGETVTCTFVNRLLQPGIEIVKTVSPGEAYPGDQVTYAFTVTNTGEATLYDVRVTDPVLVPAPPHLLFRIATLEPGAAHAATFTMTFTVPACGSGRTEPGPCPGVAGCGVTAAALEPFAGVGVLLDEGAETPMCVNPVVCHLHNVATAAGTSAGGAVVTDDDDACLTILPVKLVGGVIWHDANGNGVRDAGEPGIAQVLVTLTKPDGRTVTAKSGTGGNYAFAGVGGGRIVLVPSPPAGYPVLTTNNVPLEVVLGRCETRRLGLNFGYGAAP